VEDTVHSSPLFEFPHPSGRAGRRDQAYIAVMRTRFCLALVLALASCGTGRSSGEHPVIQRAEGIAAAAADPEELQYAPALEVNIPAMRKLPSGLLIQDVAEGSGDTLATGMMASVRYVGSLPDGTEFDSNLLGSPYRYRVGGGMVIAAWEEGLIGMRRGGKRRLVVPYALGYGELGSGPIPPYATLVFVVELVDLEK
jgi:FKBP-type peptidyl-prolyl cis-trans isomerase FkpA